MPHIAAQSFPQLSVSAAEILLSLEYFRPRMFLCREWGFKSVFPVLSWRTILDGIGQGSLIATHYNRPAEQATRGDARSVCIKMCSLSRVFEVHTSVSYYLPFPIE